MRMSVLFYSKSGNTQKAAEWIAEGMRTAGGVEVRTFSLDGVEEDFVRESSCVVLGTPIYLASMCGPVKLWLESAAMKLSLAGKIGGAFATADYLHGGAEIGIQGILSHMLVLGMLTYSGGGAFGKPVIHLGPVALKERLDESADVFTLYGQRMATKTREIFG